MWLIVWTGFMLHSRTRWLGKQRSGEKKTICSTTRDIRRLSVSLPLSLSHSHCSHLLSLTFPYPNSPFYLHLALYSFQSMHSKILKVELNERNALCLWNRLVCRTGEIWWMPSPSSFRPSACGLCWRDTARVECSSKSRPYMVTVTACGMPFHQWVAVLHRRYAAMLSSVVITWQSSTLSQYYLLCRRYLIYDCFCHFLTPSVPSVAYSLFIICCILVSALICLLTLDSG